MNEDSDNVIHVVFGPGGGRQVRLPSALPKIDSPVSQQSNTSKNDPLADVYSQSEVSRLFGLKPSRLRYWSRTNFICPSAKRGKGKYYTFQDLIGIRAAVDLINAGIPFREVRKSVDAIREALPKVVRPLVELRVVAEGRVMVVRDEAGAYEPQTGQLVLDFSVDSLRKDVVRVLRRKISKEDRQSAYEAYLEGCRLDEDESTYQTAEQCYRHALTLDPSLSNALTNLGNLRFRQDDVEGAHKLYKQALVIDPHQPEALYNLGFLCIDQNSPAEAIQFFQQALDSDPCFADAHFHLALAYERIDRSSNAYKHWKEYLKLDPHGEWSDIARKHLKS